MSVSSLSASSQNYLKAIWSLGEWSHVEVTPSALAARVGVKFSTASDAIRRLANEGLLEHAPYGAVTLTDAGRTHALAMIRRHRLIETFLVQVLGYRWDQVHDEAEALEHAVSDFMVDRLDEHLGFPERDPHGDPIPRADGTISMPEAVTLTELGPGTRARVERISDDDPTLLQHLEQHGIGLGTLLQVGEGVPFSESLDVAVVGGVDALPLGRAATDAVWVTPAGERPAS